MNLSTRRVALRDALVPGLALVVFAVLTWPVWQWLWREWMGNEYYSHGILIPPVSLYLAYQRFRNDPQLAWTPGHGSNLGVGVMAAGVALYLFFLNNRAFYLAVFAMILVIGGIMAIGRPIL